MPYDDDDRTLERPELQPSPMSSPYDSELLENNSEFQRLIAESEDDSGYGMPRVEEDHRCVPTTRALLIRTLALLCACSLSVGSH